MERNRRTNRLPALHWSVLSAIAVAAMLLPFSVLTAAGDGNGVAAGTLEGTVSLRAPGNERTADRYVSGTGEARDIERVPVVVYLEGDVSGGAPSHSSDVRELVQRGEAFHPSLLVVPVGTQVRFPNDDPLFHNVFSYSRAKRFDLGRYRRGESKTVLFDKPGYVKVMCEVHKWMRAGVLVVQNRYYAVVPESGRFRIEGIPPGRYRVIVEHFDRRSQLDVEITDGRAATIDVKL